MDVDPSKIKLLGVAYDASSSYLRGAADGPTAMREQLYSGSANWDTELGLNVDPQSGLWRDLGDLDGLGDLDEFGDLDRSGSAERAAGEIQDAVGSALADGSRLLTIGGDHFITWPIVNALSDSLPVGERLTIVHFDAHPDLYDHLDGDRYSHACPFARIMEDHPDTRLVQLGIRTATAHQRDQAERFGVEMIEMRSWDGVVPALSGPVYVSIDLDVLDPAFAPGVSHYEPGGMSTRRLLSALHQFVVPTSAGRDRSQDATGSFRLIGADIVELNPSRDVHGATAMVAAKLVRELLGLMSW